MRKSDLINPTPEDIRQFVVAVAGLACQDFAEGRKSTRTGSKIANMCADRYRIFHRSMATGIYNKTIWTLKSAGQ